MAIENLPLFSAMNREEVKPPFPHPQRPLTSQEAHFAIMEKVNACIAEVNHFEQRVRYEMEQFIAKTESENTGFKEAIQASYNAFMETVQREINNFEQASQNNFDLFRNDIDKRVADFETAINNSFTTLQGELIKASDAKIAELEELRVTLLKSFNDYKATLNVIVANFKTQVNQHMEEQNAKIEEYKNYMVDNILDSTETVFNEKARNGEITEIMKAVYGEASTFKGSATYDEIQAITNANNGDYYYCTTDEHYYQRSENAWIDVGNGERLNDDYEAFKLNTENKFTELRNADIATLYEGVANSGHYGDSVSIPLTMLSGYLDQSNHIMGSDNEELKHSDYVAVIPCEVLYVTTAPSIQHAILYYDKDKNFISGDLTSKVCRSAVSVVPSNAYFARVNKCENTVATAMLERATVKNNGVNFVKALVELAENENTFIEQFVDITSNYGITMNAFIDRNSGNVTEYSETASCTDFISVDEVNFFVCGYGDLSVALVAFYNENKELIKTEGVDGVSWNYKKVDKTYLMNTCPNAKYVRFSSLNKYLFIYDVERVSLHYKIHEICDDLNIANAFEDITANFETTAGFIDKWNGTFREETNSIMTTDTLEVDENTVFAVTGFADFSTAIMSLLDVSGNFICAYGCNDATDGSHENYGVATRFTREIFTKRRLDNIAKTSVKYVRFSSYANNPLIIENVSFISVKEKVAELSEKVETLTESVDTLLVTSEKPWKNKVWVAFGDSLTEKNVTCEKHYHDNIADEMGITVLNHGTSGSGYFNDGNEAWYLRINDVANIDFDIITFFGSGNDMSCGLEMGTASDTGLETLGGVINTTLDNLFAIKPLAKVGLVTPTPWAGNMPHNNGKMKAYSDLIVEIGVRRSIPVLDLFRSSTLNPNESTALHAFFYNGDGCHPNDEGHKRITPQFREFLRTLL